MTPLRVEVIRELSDLLAIAHDWDALVERARIEHPFLRHDWVLSWWESFGADKQIHVVVVRDENRMIAIAPLMQTRPRIYGLSVSCLEFIANVHTPRFDFIVAERADEAYAAIVDCLAECNPSWDIVKLPDLAESSPTGVALRELAATRSLRSAVWVAGASPCISLRSGFESFYAQRSAKHRSSMRRHMRKLSELGPVTLEVVSSAEQVVEALEEGLRIEVSSWKGEAGTAIGLHSDLKCFYKLVAERAARAGTLCLLFLRVGEKRIAFGYCLRQGRKLYLLKTGYDPQYANHSPFNILLLLAIEAACRDGLEAIDLLGEDEPWKRFWTDELIERRWFFLHGNSLRAQLIFLLKFVVVPRVRAFLRPRSVPALEPQDCTDSSEKLVQAEP